MFAQTTNVVARMCAKPRSSVPPPHFGGMDRRMGAYNLSHITPQIDHSHTIDTLERPCYNMFAMPEHLQKHLPHQHQL